MSTDHQAKADEILQRASLAAAEFGQLGAAETDRIVRAVCLAGLENRVSLAKLAWEETGRGEWKDKVLKNVVGSLLVYQDIKDEKTVGVILEDPDSGITEIAQPLGPILGIIPVTNPTSTVLFKILISLKARNPIIISPHRDALACCGRTAEICYRAALQAGAPEDCIQWLSETSRELTHALMSHPRLALVLATGGPGLVKAAYSSGTPAIGVGSGNVPVFLERSADIPLAVESILASKTFDNGTICASEQALVVEKEIVDRVRRELERHGAYFLSPDETAALEKVAINPETGLMSPRVVGQSAVSIAEMAGFEVPPKTVLLMAPQDEVGEDRPLSGEILAPILAFYVRDGFDEALKLCIALNYRGGIGHTASIHSTDEKMILRFSELMNAGRCVVNMPSSQGAVGGMFNRLPVSFTLGCGAGGKNITTENISARNLINVKRVCRRRDNPDWFRFPPEYYLDETRSAGEILTDYGKSN